jgi:hypothetical protein
LWDVFVWHHNIERGLGGSLTQHPWWYYGPRVLVDLLPWSLLLPFAVYRSVRRREPGAQATAERTLLDGSPSLARRVESFGLIWFLATLVFLSLMRFKRADYLLPAYPGFALWLGGVLERWLEKMRATTTIGTWRLRTGGVALVVMTCVAGWGIYLTWIGPNDGDAYRRFAAEIRRHTDGPVIFFRAEAHEVAFHVRRPLDTILEWENLEVWANRPEPIYFVMPPDCAAAWQQNVKKGELVEVLRTTDLGPGERQRPLVLMRSVPAGQDRLARRY